MKKSFIYVLAMVAATSAAVALADDHGDGGEGKDKKHHGPPIEALKACEGKSAGAKVQFETRNGRTINGTCKLIAVPERLAEGGDHDDHDDHEDDHEGHEGGSKVQGAPTKP